MNSINIIGTPIKIINLEVAQNDFPEEMDWDTAIQTCLDLGDGWRLPLDKELNILYQNKDKIGGFNGYYYWSSSEDNNDGTYDVQHTNEWSWLGVVKRVPALNIQPRTQENDKGKGIWRFEGLSDSEDDAFRSDASADEDAEKSTEKRETCNQSKPFSLSVQQFGQLDSVLEAAGWNAQDCEDALERIAALLRRTNEGQFRAEDTASPPSPLNPSNPVPASVVINPVPAATRRMRWFWLSTKRIFPTASTAIWRG
jgi:hypothetical protein